MKLTYSRVGMFALAFALLVVLLVTNSGATATAASPFTPGTLVVYRVGDGSAALSNAATVVNLDEYTTGGSKIQSLPMPTAVSGLNQPLTANGTATSEGFLSRSADGRYLVVAGYAAVPGTASVTNTASPRLLGVVDSSGLVLTRTALSDVTTGNPRAAVSTNGTDLWLTTSGAGVRYAMEITSWSTQLSTSPTNVRAAGIFGGQLYITSGSSGFIGVSSVGSGVPNTGGQTTTLLPGFVPIGNSPSPYGFVILDTNSGVAGLDTAYVADDRTVANGGGIQKWTFDGSTWSLAYTMNSGLGTGGVRGLVADTSGANLVLYATTTETSANRIVAVTDTGTSSAFSTKATAPFNTAFRGIAMAPVNSGDTTPPTVLSTAPANGATGVDVNSSVNVNFSEDVNVSENSFTLSCTTSGTRTFWLNGFGASYTLTQTSWFAYNETCTGTIVAANVHDLSGNAMATDYVWTFTTLNDITPPTVTSTDPANGATNVPKDATITVQFSEGVTSASGGAWPTISCTSSGNHVSSLQFGFSDLSLMPTSPFANDETCTVSIFGTFIRDIAGNQMAENYTFSFATVSAVDTTPPTVQSTSPADGATGVALDAPIILTFSENLATAGYQAPQCSKSGTHLFDSLNHVGPVWTLGLDTPFTYDETCTMTISAARTSDTSGNQMAQDYTFSFQTVPPDPLTGAGSASPATQYQGLSAMLTVNVSTGANPPSGTVGVTCDLSPIGLANNQALSNGGSGATFTYNATIPANSPTGTKTINCSITDTARPGHTYMVPGFSLTVNLVLAIHDVQGNGHLSPYSGQRVMVRGIVTAVATSGSKGFWVEAPQNEWDTNDGTSEGIFVYMGSAQTPSVGQGVNVTGNVTEYRSGSANATLTQLSSSPTYTVVSSGNSLPPAILIGTGGRVPPSSTIEPGSCDVETTCTYDPANHGIDFWESMEGMLVQFNNPVAVGPYGSFGIAIVADDATSAVRTPRGGIVIRPNDANPERIILAGNAAALPSGVDVGDHLSGAVVGVVDYASGVYKMQATSSPTVIPGGLAPVSAMPQGVNQVAVATFNVENLAPTSSDATYTTLAGEIINNLKAPDILAIEEIQDNSGAANDGTVAADVTWGKLIQFISTASGNTITYEYRQIDPVNNAEGGAPGANIRVGFLFRTDRGVSFVDRPGGTSTNGTTVVNDASGVHLTYSPGRVDPANPAWATPEGTRRSLAGEFMFNGHHLFVIANHWKSKSDAALYAHVQPPTLTTEPQRIAQAQSIRDFVNSILTQDSNADIVVLGDLNDFQYSNPLATLTGTGNEKILNDLIETLPENERYTYVYDGNSQTLDHILTSNHLFNKSPFVYLPIHVNAEFNPQASDHDPQVVTLTLNSPPTVSAGGPYQVDEGKTVTLNATGSDPELGALTFAWDLDDNGSFEASGASVTFDATNLDGPSTHTVRVQVVDNGGLTATDSATVTVNNVPPTIVSVTNNGPINEGSSATITVSATDPASANDPLQYEFDCNNDGTFEVGPQSSNSNSCHFGDNGTFTAKVRVTDGDGGSILDSTSVTVKNVAPTATFNTPASPEQKVPFTLWLTNPSDPSKADTDAGFWYAFDCGEGAGLTPFSATNNVSCTPKKSGSHTFRAQIKDKDGGVTEYMRTVFVLPKVRTDVNIFKTVEPSGRNGIVNYSIIVKNLGSYRATSVVVTDVLPPEVSYLGASISSAAGTCSYSAATRRVTCRLARLQPGATWKVIIKVRWVGGTDATNCALVSTATYDTNVDNNRSCIRHDPTGKILPLPTGFAPMGGGEALALLTDRKD